MSSEITAHRVQDYDGRRMAELAGALFWKGKEPVLVLRGFTGYCDESGHPDDPNVNAFALGGCVASAENWVAFDAAWMRALEDEHVPRDKHGYRWFHMKDFAHSQGVFTGWSEDEERRRRLLGRLVGAMVDHDLAYVGVAWQFKPGESRHDLDHYYYLAYRMVILYAEPFAHGEEISFIFSLHEEINPAFYEDHHRKVREAYASGRNFGDLTYGNPRRSTPLQAADLIVYEVRANASNLTRLRWPLQQLPKERCRFELLSEFP